jgi:outer membrane protein assembly factor BamE
MLTNQPRSINAMQRISRIIICLSALWLCASCSHYKFPWVYRIDVEQGNVLDEQQIAQLQVGMTQKQVKFLLGSPMVQDTFKQNRWDYFYSMRTGKGIFNRQRITLTFEGNTLSNIEKKDYETRELIY